MGMTLAMLFSQAPCGLFFPHGDFYLRLRKGRLMALFYRFPFPYDSRPPKITGFAYADKIHVFRPFRLAALVCRSARCGYLTPYLSVPKRTDEFLIFQASKIRFPTKKALCFSLLRLLLSVSYLLTFFVFTIYRLVAVVSLLKVCIFFVSVFPVCLSGLFPFRVQFNNNTKFLILQIFFFALIKKRL